VILSLLVLGAGAVPLFAHAPEGTAVVTAAVDRILVLKSERKLILLSGDAPVREYRVSLGRNPEGHKRREGDNRTPEGLYRIDWRNQASAYHLSLHVSYPEAEDVEAARRRGVSPGGEIMIHGLPNGWGFLGRLHRLRDWTRGCIAVTDREIREIWSLVPDGTPIEIRG